MRPAQPRLITFDITRVFFGGTEVSQRWLIDEEIAARLMAEFGEPLAEWVETDEGSGGYSDAFPINEDGTEPA
ncbi:hypothetical protein [Microbispora rosea]|uniref:hypothetical protein n=1 Tax=Microbispora rosea TaxID=58117 RepID=UPI0037A789E4